MDLARHWMSQSLRASGVSLVIPFAALVAAALVAAGGGGLDSLGQLTSGPAPPASLDELAGDQSATGTVAGPSSVGGGGGVGTAGRGGATAATTAGVSGRGGPSVRTPTSTGPGGGRPSAPQAPTTPVATSPGGSSPTPGPSQTGTVEQLGNTVRGVAGGTPQPVGDTVDRLIDPVVGVCKQAGCP